nr:uncharacterized protein CI109_001670 [Kwoniella shandongensis]KAA5529731.1 hypothetical protein CI109_001670 [Kwoniella shandongensis]
MAEAVLKHQISQRPEIQERFEISVDSAGTGAYHEGDSADSRTVAVCRKHKVPISCIARAVTKDDFTKFDYILAMDQNNLQTLLHRQPSSSKSHVTLFGSFDPSIPLSSIGSNKIKARAIDDPYYGGKDGFESSFKLCEAFAGGFLDYLERKERR